MKTPLSSARGISLALLVGFLTAPLAALSQIPYDPPTSTGYRSDFYPPRDSSLDGAGPVQFPGTPIVARSVRFHSPATTKPSPPAGQNVLVTCGVTFVAEVSSNGGAQFDRITGPATLILRTTNAGPAPTGGTLYQTEMLALDLQPGTLPAGVLLRESPTLASLGQATITPLAGGYYQIDSFFDIFTEISLNGGANWLPGAPLHVEMHQLAPELFNEIAVFPPPGEFVGVAGQDTTAYPPVNAIVTYATDRNPSFAFHTSTEATALPSIHGTTDEVILDLSLDGGATHERVTASGEMTMRIATTTVPGVFQTEMLAMTLSGDYDGGGGGIVMIRESPTRASLGKSAVRDVPGGSELSSFFDVFTEISFDGGTSWVEGTQAMRIAIAPPMPNVLMPQVFYPPRTGRFAVDNNDLPVLFGNGMLMRNLRHTDFHENAPLPAPGASATFTSTHTVSFETSSDNGATWQARSATGVMAIACNAGPDQTFDTEMLSLTVTVGNFPNIWVIRESPTRRSLGRVGIRLPTETDNPLPRLSSFFDIFPEISTDGGATWHAADKPASVQLGLVPPQDFYSSDFLPLSATFASIYNAPEKKERFVGANTPIIRGSALGGLNSDASRTAPPGPGATSIHSFFDVFTCEMSLDGGATFLPVSAPAAVTTRTAGLSGGGTTRTFDTEMLQLDVQGGSLPPGMMLRESPTRASTGRTTIVSVDGGFRIGSFFDIFTEVSVDGGATWLPAVQKVRHAADANVAPLIASTSNLPTPGSLRTHAGDPGAQTAAGFVFHKIEMTYLTGEAVPQPSPGGSAMVSQSGTAEITWTPAPGQPQMTARAPVNLHTSTRSALSALPPLGPAQTFDTEMLALDIQGGGMPPGMMVRESPTRASTGRRTVSANDVHHNRVESFFDIFTEVSLDGGATWQETDRPLRLELVPEPPRIALPNQTLAGAATISNAPGTRGRSYPLGAAGGGGGAGKVQMQDFHFTATTPPVPLPAAGTSVVGDFSGDGRLDLILPDGTSAGGACTVAAQVQVTHRLDSDGTRVFDTEMLSMNLTSSVPTVLIRESPTLPSRGGTKARQLPGGSWAVDSFFDIFTEISLDGGATWSRSDGCFRFDLLAVPPATQPSSTHFATTDFFPPPGVFEFGDMQFSDGSMLSKLVWSPRSNIRVALTAPGEKRILTLDGTLAFDYTDALGATAHVVYGATVQIAVTQCTSGEDRYFTTEMLALSLNGLPPGTPVLRLRESPTLPSLGGTRVTDAPGGFMVSSFFDIFTEISLDGGATWLSAKSPSHGELEPSPPIVGVPTDFYPPRHGLLATLRNAPATVFGVFPHMHQIRNLQVDDFANNARLGNPLVTEIQVPVLTKFDYSSDGGATWQPQSAPATVTLHVTRLPADPETFEMEMLQLDIAGGTLPAGVRLRESPTRASTGRTTLVPQSDGSFRIGSFFDIFTELSADGGATWSPAAQAALVHHSLAPRADFHASDFLPLAGVMAMDDWETPVAFTNRAAILNFTCQFVDGRRIPPPPPGGTTTHELTGDASVSITVPGDVGFVDISTTISATIRTTNTGDGTFDTEMLALSVQGGDLPPNVRLRESPTRASLGRIQIDTTRGGFRISSFFDVFTEISLDGGATWSPATDTMHLGQHAAFDPVVEASGNYPPMAEMEMPPGDLAPRAQGQHIKSAKLFVRKAGGEQQEYYSITTPVIIESFHTLLWDTQPDLGSVEHHASDVRVVVRLTPRDGEPGAFDTEMLALDLLGGGAFRLRESPTRASLGRTTVRQLPGGNWAVDSFFDIFTELSVDGGASWEPTDMPLSLVIRPAPVGVTVAAATVPGGSILSHALGSRGREYPTDAAAGGGGGGAGKASFSDLSFFSSSPPAPLPAPGAAIVADLSGDGNLALFLPDGTPVRANVNVQAQALVTSDFDLGGTRYFDTEMLQLNLAGSGLPPGLLIRESPTLPSKGRTSARMLPGGSWAVDSFFDIFTEISFDGGASWTPSDGPLRLVPATRPPDAPLPGTHFATTDFFPPPGELRLITELTFANGERISDLRFLPSPTSPRVPIPPPGVSIDVLLDGTFTFRYSPGPAPAASAVIVLPGQMLVRLTGGADGPIRYFDTEMLALSLNGLPPGVPALRLRESPTLPSRGGTRIEETPGGYRIGSFFDIFTELSLDGGATWSPASTPGRVELHPAARELLVPTDFYPPRNAHLRVDNNEPPIAFVATPARVRNLRHDGFTNNARLGNPLVNEVVFPHLASCEISLDGGNTWQPHTAPATARVRLSDADGDGVFDTEMLQLDISGGSLPAAIRLRESPTRASLGRTTVHAHGTGGNFRIGSFFDIFTEISLDSGASWSPAEAAAHVAMDRDATPEFHVSNFLPLAGELAPMVAGGIGFCEPEKWTSVEVPSIRISDANVRWLPPPPETPRLDSWAVVVEMLVPGADGTPTPVSVPATMDVRVTNVSSSATGTQVFDTEMFALDLQGATLPPGMRLRESPSRPSLGRIQIDTTRGGFRIGSFFDVFTELSLDGGASWAPAVDTLRIEQRITSGQPVIVDNDRLFSRGEFETLPGALPPRTEFGMHLEEISLGIISSDGIPLPPVGSTTTATLEMECAIQFRQEFGPVQPQRHTALVTIQITPRDAFGNTRTFDTEMLAMNLTGGGGGGGAGGSIMLRESPTRASTGKYTVTDLGDGTFRVDSFFDIFTEISLDGGTTWLATDVPAQAMLLPAVQKIREAAARLPQHAGASEAAAGRGLRYGSGGGAGKVSFFDVFFDARTPLPDPHVSSIADLNGNGRLDIAAPFIPGGAVVSAAVSVHARIKIDTSLELVPPFSFDTEMLQLSITGPTLPAGLLIRESPTLPSKGRTTARHLPDGTWRVDSFFDIFTELSLDGGTTWQPSDGPMRLEFTGQSRGIVTGPDAGSAPEVAGFTAPDLAPDYRFLAYPSGFTGGVRVAVGDVNGDGVEDIITGAGAGAGPHVKVFSGVDHRLIRSFLAYEPAFAGGVNVAAGDVNGDGVADIITGAGAGAAPHVKVFDGRTGQLLQSFFAYGPAFAGGVRVAAGDVNGDGFADIVTGAGSGAQPHVKVFDGRTVAELHSFFAFDSAFTGGVFVAAGDVNGDGLADIVCGADSGAAPHVRVFDGGNLTEIRSFFAYPAGFTGGVRVAAGDVNGDGLADIITGAGAGALPHVKVFDGRTSQLLQSVLAYDPAFTGGVFVAGIPPAPRFASDPLDYDGDGLLDTWEYARFGSIDPATFDTDSDDDGLSDGLELGIGSNPLVPDAFGQLPVTVEGGFLTLTIQRQPGALYRVETGRRLLPGLPDSFSPDTTTILIDTPNLLKVRDNIPVGTPPSRFIRVEVIGAP